MKTLLMLSGLLMSSFTVMGAAMSNQANNFYKSDTVTASPLEKTPFAHRRQAGGGLRGRIILDFDALEVRR